MGAVADCIQGGWHLRQVVGAAPPALNLAARSLLGAVQAQVLYLSSNAAMPGHPTTQLGSSLVAMRVVDDLCGRVRVGDRVLAAGRGRYHGTAGSSSSAASNLGAQLPYTLGLQVGL